MNPLEFALRRLLFAIVVLLSVLTITFFLSHNLGINPIVAWLGKTASAHPQLVKLYITEYHLNDSLWVQYYYYLVGILHGNFGYSTSRGFVPVLTVISETLPLTLQLVFLGFVFTLGLGILFGVLSARYNHTPADEGIRGFYLIGYGSPPFFVALILLVLFTLVFHIFPSGGAFSPTVQQPTPITGIPLLDSLLEGNWSAFLDGMEHAILPALALALTTFGVVTRVLRTSILDVMQTNYIRAARARGLSENTIFYGHAFRNALIPVVSLSSVVLTWLITGTVFVENVFSYPGIGQYLVNALTSEDYPGIMATAIVFAVVIVIGNLIVDILYAVVDPQIRLGE